MSNTNCYYLAWLNSQVICQQKWISNKEKSENQG